MSLLNSLLMSSLIISNLLITFLNPVHSLTRAPRYIPRRYPYPPPPRIWLSEYFEEDSFTGIPTADEFQTVAQFENEFISKNGTDYTLRDGVSSVVFACQAKYPIMWAVPTSSQITARHKYLISSSTTRGSEFPPGADHPVDKYFKSLLILSISGENFFSVTFNCQAANPKGESTSQKSSLHVYLEGREVFEKEGETISVSLAVNSDDYHSRTKTSLVLPCRPSRPDIPITLEKQTVDGNWTQFRSNLFSFDPKLGFEYVHPKWRKRLIGLYRCTVNGSDVGRDVDVFVLFNVTSTGELEPETPQFEPHLVVKGNATVERKGLFSEKVICCSGVSAAIPTMYIYSCEDHLQCEITKAIRVKDSTPQLYPESSGEVANGNCSQSLMYQSPALPRCLGKNIDFAGEFVEILRPGVTQLANRSEYFKKMTSPDEYSQKLLTIFEDAAKANKASVQEKMLIAVGQYTTLDEAQRANHFLTSPFYGFSQMSYYSSGENDEMEERIVEYSRNYYYDDEPLRLMCFGLKYFYNEGGYLRLNWKNGSKSIVERGPTETNRYVYFYEDAAISYFNFRYMFGTEIKASLEMESVDCFRSVWNNAQWDKLTYNISTRVSIPPTFGGGEQEDAVYFQLNDTDKEISWRVEGTPKPEVSVIKDGKALSSVEFKSTLDEYNSTGNASNLIQIKFATVTYEMHGTYKCIAKNVKGKVMKTIKVFITDKQSTLAIPIVLTCVSLLSALLLTTGIKYKLQLGQIWRLRGHR